MLSNKYFCLTYIFIISVLLFSCGDDESSKSKVEPVADFGNPEAVMKEAEKTLGPDTKFAFKGSFDKDSVIEVAAGLEIENQDNWGIKFALLKLVKNKLETVYKSDLLEGSFNESLMRKIKFPDFDYELVYYNSQDYFMGSGGGEVFSYIVDFNNRNIYYAHLFSEGEEVSLYLSENTDNYPEIKSFFSRIFRKDYANLKITSQDEDLDY